MSDAYAAVDWLLGQAEPEARRIAVQQIVKVDGERAPRLLVRGLGDDDWRVRKEAAAVAPLCAPRSAVVTALVAALAERDAIGLRNAAVEALVAIGLDAVPAAVDALDHLDEDGRKLAVEVLGGVLDGRGVAALARVLSADPDANVRVAAAEALGGAAVAGEEARDVAVAALVAALTAPERFVKVAALESLSRLDAELSWSVFAPHARDPVLRRHAIAAAAGIREPAALEALACALEGGSATVAREATVALAQTLLVGLPGDAIDAIARRELSARPAAHAWLRHAAADDDARGAAMVVLGALADPDDIPLLVAGLGDDAVAERAEVALRRFGAGAVGAILAAGRGGSPPLRASLLALGAGLSGSSSPPLLAEARAELARACPEPTAAALKVVGAGGEAQDLARLLPLVRHPDPRVSQAASAALAGLAARFPLPARAALSSLDAGGDEAVAGCAILTALGQGGVGELDHAFLQRALAHGDPRARRAAVEAFAAIGGEAAAEGVSFALTDEESDVRLAAVRALGKLGRAEPLLTLIGAERDASTLAAALRAVGDADPDRAFVAARPLVQSADAAIACAAVEAIGRLPLPGRADALFEALEHGDPEVVKVALSELGTELDARALARLGRCLDHDSWEVRRIVAELLGQQSSPNAQALLRSRYERERDPVVKDALAYSVSVRPPPPGRPGPGSSAFGPAGEDS